MRQDWGLGQFLPLQELREGRAATILCIDLLDLDRVVAQEVVQRVEFVTTVVADILPKDFEAKNATVIVQEALKAAIGTATLQFDLDVVLEFGLIGRHLFHVNHGSGVFKWVFRVVLRLANVSTLVGKVGASELVAVDDAEDTVIDVKVHTEMQIGPVIIT